MSEPFSLIKMLSGPFQGVYWAKVVMYGFGLGFLVFVSIGVWRGYFKKPADTTSQSADSMVNNYYQPKAGMFGCATIKAAK